MTYKEDNSFAVDVVVLFCFDFGTQAEWAKPRLVGSSLWLLAGRIYSTRETGLNTYSFKRTLVWRYNVSKFLPLLLCKVQPYYEYQCS